MVERQQGAEKLGDAGYGPRLSDEDYEQRLVKLYESLPAMPDRREEEKVRRQELELKIDNRLGSEFPAHLREVLWNIQCDIEKRRLRLAGKYLLKRLFSRGIAKDADGLVNGMVDEYAQVLSKADLERFFDLKEGKRPALPIEIQSPKRK